MNQQQFEIYSEKLAQEFFSANGYTMEEIALNFFQSEGIADESHGKLIMDTAMKMYGKLLFSIAEALHNKKKENKHLTNYQLCTP